MSIKKILDTKKEIMDIDSIINPYIQYGSLDRQKALEKIQNIRLKDIDNCAITLEITSPNNPKVNESSDEILVQELIFWKKVLFVKQIMGDVKDEQRRNQLYKECGITEEEATRIQSMIKSKG